MCSCGLQPATPYWSRSSFCEQVVGSCRVGPSCFVLMLRNREAREVFGIVCFSRGDANARRACVHASVGSVRTASACLKSHMSRNAWLSMYGVSSMATFHGLQPSTIHCDSMWVGRYGISSSSSARRLLPGRLLVSGVTCAAALGGMDHAKKTGLARIRGRTSVLKTRARLASENRSVYFEPSHMRLGGDGSTRGRFGCIV